MEKKERYVYEHLLFKRDDRQTVSSAVNLVAFLSSDDTKECGQVIYPCSFSIYALSTNTIP